MGIDSTQQQTSPGANTKEQQEQKQPEQQTEPRADEKTDASAMTDAELMQHAEAEVREERLLAAARLLRKVHDPNSLEDEHRRILQKAEVFEAAVSDLLATPSAEHGWRTLGQTNGQFASSIYYKLEQGAKMTCRMESPVPSSLLVPLLSVLNESSLYRSWIPHWDKPVRLGVQESRKLIQDSRGHQILKVKCAVPWPMAAREVIIDAHAVDDIDEQGFVAVKMSALDDQTPSTQLPDGFEVPPLEKGTQRIDYAGAILLRACPDDHPARKKDDDVVLIQFKIYFDAKLAMLPKAVINFVTRTAIGTIWSTFLHVSSQVRDGTRPDTYHQEAIDANPEFYQWLQHRADIMLNGLKNETAGDAETQADVAAANLTTKEAIAPACNLETGMMPSALTVAAFRAVGVTDMTNVMFLYFMAVAHVLRSFRSS